MRVSDTFDALPIGTALPHVSKKRAAAQERFDCLKQPQKRLFLFANGSLRIRSENGCAVFIKSTGFAPSPSVEGLLPQPFFIGRRAQCACLPKKSGHAPDFFGKQQSALKTRVFRALCCNRHAQPPAGDAVPRWKLYASIDFF
nr:hypothetical protein [uncultured Agathobaculum sp.]